jgi:dTMP kinase
MPPQQSLARVRREKDRIEQRPMSYHEQVRKNYLSQVEADPKRYRLIAADRAKEQVHEDVLKAVSQLARDSL